jgi:hypothetical protein
MLKRFTNLVTSGESLMLLVAVVALTAFGPPGWRTLAEAVSTAGSAAAQPGAVAIPWASPDQESAVLDQFAATNAALNAKYIAKDRLIFANGIAQTRLAMMTAAPGSLLQHHLMQQLTLYQHQQAELTAVIRLFGHNPPRLANALLNEERHWAQEATEFNRHFSQELLQGSPFAFRTRFYL